MPRGGGRVSGLRYRHKINSIRLTVVDMVKTAQNKSFRRDNRYRFCAAALALSFCAIGLGGCASVGGDDVVAAAYVNPSRYDLYNCLQLRTARRETGARVAEVQKLMDKAQGGFAGGVVSEVAYRNDYNTARGQLLLADRVWQRNRCDSERLPPEKITAKPTSELALPESDQQSRPGESYLRPQPDR